jgi:hypothetical protein
VEAAVVHKWQETRLWGELSNRSEEPAERVARAVANVLPNVEVTLASGDSAPGSFTLHDADHSWRVAERIYELAGAEVIAAVGPYDLGLLLLSAYLHDIGMTPPVAKLDSSLAYLLFADHEALSEGEFDELQTWLDDEAPEVAPPLAGGQPTAASIRNARSLIAQYVRSRHNDWSAIWIKEHLVELDEQTYDGCLTDLILLCKSHHFGIDLLRSDKFEPRLVGAGPATVLHLRYNACLLRVADVLDFDPERTPKILYEHRDVEASSAIFWHKDHAMSFAQEGSRVSIDARPPDAITHHAVELTIADVDRELRLVRQLADEMPFDHRATGEESLPHRWQMEMSVHQNVKPRDDSYVFMDGTFRPDQERILELLGGVALYGSPLAAVRELLQNAFDAIKEQIAYQRLSQDEPAAQSTYDQFAATHRITLKLEQSEEGVRLICRDTGVGMSREIIESRFLISGTGTSHETRALERTCEAEGFSLGRTARFGIGVLAYFLLGARLRISTRRSPDTRSMDADGWTFTSHGLTDFGELRRENCPVGTEVELLIRPDAMPHGVARFARDLDAYLRRTVRRVPCHFSFIAPGSELEPFSSSPGWVERAPEIKKALVAGFSMPRKRSKREDPSLYASDHRNRIERQEQRWVESEQAALEVLELTHEEGSLPYGLGTFRIFVGSFRIEDARLLVYLDHEHADNGNFVLKPINSVSGVELSKSFEMCWNGMHVESAVERNDRLLPGLCVEIDWTDDLAGEIKVDRGTILLSDEADEAIEFVRQKGRSMRARLVRDCADSPLALLNARAARVAPESIDTPMWPQAVSDSESPTSTPVCYLQPLRLPAIDVSDFEHFDITKATWKGAPVFPVPAVKILSGEYGGTDSWLWHTGLFAPQAVGMRQYRQDQGPFLIWTAVKPDGDQQRGPYGSVIEFPPSWSHLLRVYIDTADRGQGTRAWNSEHVLLYALDSAAWSWANETFAESADPLGHAGDLMQSPARMAAWILLCIQQNRFALWNGLPERAPEFLVEAWDLVGLDEGSEILDWERDFAETTLRRISPSAWEELSYNEALEAFGELMSDPGDEWWLMGPNGTRELSPLK